MSCKHLLQLIHEKLSVEFVDLIGIMSSRHFEFREFLYIKMNKLKILVMVYFQIMKEI